jgi:hypothetical protein
MNPVATRTRGGEYEPALPGRGDGQKTILTKQPLKQVEYAVVIFGWFPSHVAASS